MAFSIKYTLTGMLLIASGMCQTAVTESLSETDTNDPEGASSGSALTYVPKYLVLFDGTKLETYKSSSSVSFVYFFKTIKTPGVDFFLREYDKSAGYLNAYGVTLGLVDCSGLLTDEKLKSACEEADAEQIYVYRNNADLLTLGLESMFDVNSIMSNVLQLALLDEVLIVQTKKNRQQLEHDNAGQMDIIYSYHNAIGTYEHRVFMEIAYAYQDKYKFIVTTEPSSIADLQDAESVSENSVVAMWVLYCRDKYNAATGCRSVNYRGEFNLLAVATFFKQLSWPRVTGILEDSHPCEKTPETACIYIFHTKASEEQVKEVVDSLQFDVHGMAGLIVQQVESSEGKRDPQLTIELPGEKVVAFTQTWNLENIEVFVSSHIFSLSDKGYEEVTMKTENVDDSENEEDRIAEIDDMVWHVAYDQWRTIGKAPAVPALTDKTFYPTVRERKLTIVLFYIPFDSMGMLFLGPYQEAKQATLKEGEDPSAHPLMRVNCFDWTDICAKENITTYPVIHIYRDGGKRQQYRHALDKDVLARTVFLLQAEQPIMLMKEEDVEAFVKGHLPEGSHRMVDNLVVLNLSKTQKELTAFKEAAKELETQMLFAIVSPGVKTSLVPEGSVLHVRLNDEYQPSETLTEDLSAESIKEFLLKGHFNLLPELTHLNFPALYTRKQPFGVLFYEPSTEDANSLLLTIVNTIKTNKAPGIIFCKMSMEKNPVAEAILANYTQELVLPSFAIVNHIKGHVHVLQGADVLSEKIMLPWIHDVQDGSLPPTKILEKGEWKPPGRHYDFLALMDMEKQKKKKKGYQTDYNSRSENGASPFDEIDENSNEQEEMHDEKLRHSLLEMRRPLLASKLRARTPAEATEHNAASKMDTATSEMEGDENVIKHTEL